MTQVDDTINFANIRNSDGRETSGRTIKGEVGLHDLAVITLKSSFINKIWEKKN